MGLSALNITQLAPTHPVVDAQEFKHESKELCTEFEISIFDPEAPTISVEHNFRKFVLDVEVNVELLTSGQPAVSTMTVDVDGDADVVVLGCSWTLQITHRLVPIPHFVGGEQTSISPSH